MIFRDQTGGFLCAFFRVKFAASGLLEEGCEKNFTSTVVNIFREAGQTLTLIFLKQAILTF
jgi:hypothetical protein